MMEFLEDLDYTHVIIAVVFWLIFIVMIWKFVETDVFKIKLYIKMIMSIVSLPICYFIVIKIGDK